MFIPRTAAEIRDSWLARLVARSKVNDTTEGGVAYAEAYAVGEEIQVNDYRTWVYRNSFDILSPTISLADFIERAKELPGNGFAAPLGATAAGGSVFMVSRKAVLAEQTMPAGATFTRNDGSQAVYRTIVDVVFGIGIASVANVYAVCTTTGTTGNAGVGIISKSINAPSWVIGVVNTAKITNGLDAETLKEAQNRARLYLSALGGSQKAALEYLALSFVSSQNVRAKFAKGFVDPEIPGYAELVVDDGSGFEGLVSKGLVGLMGAVPPGGQTIIAHASPATKTLGSLSVLRVATNAVDVLTEEAKQLVSVYEAGYMYVPAKKMYSLLEGDIWSLAAFDTYTGFLAELQRKVSGDANDFFQIPGWAAFGCRVAVKPPTKQNVTMDVHVVPQSGIDLEAVETAVINVVTEFIGNLGPGEPLYISALVAAVMANSDVLNVRMHESGSTVFKQDVYPSERAVLRTEKQYIVFVSAS